MTQKDSYPVAERMFKAYCAANNYVTGRLANVSEQPGGIINIGNTCYMNAVLQVLAAHLYYRNQIAGAPNSALRRALELAICLINNTQIVSADIAEIVRRALVQAGWHHGYREQDPAELLNFIADKLAFQKTLFLSQNVVRNDQNNDNWQVDEAHILPLDLYPDIDEPIRLGDCLGMYRYSDLPESELGHDQRIEIYRSVRARTRALIPIQMKRFGERINNQQVEFFMDRRKLTGMHQLQGQSVIPLSAVIVHLGGEPLTTGHYHAYVFRNGRAYQCNDSLVSDVTGQQGVVATAHADGYVYFYQN